MPVEEVWSPRDERARRAFVEALSRRDLCGALHAIERADEDAIRATHREIVRLASLVEASGVASMTPEGQREVIAHVLGDAGFTGQTRRYHTPENSHLSRVVERRTGLPILLSAVWMLVGERAGVTVDGIGLPAHFIVRVGGEEGALADPFGAGRALSEDDCRALLARVAPGGPPFKREMIAKVTLPQLLERVLRNLVHGHTQQSDLVGVHRIATMLCALRPESAELLLFRAGAASKLHDERLARAAYEEVVTRFSGTREAQAAAAELSKLARPRSLN